MTMHRDDEKRSSTTGIDQAVAEDEGLRQGVGGRQGIGAPQVGGGGYPNNCTILNFQNSAQKKRDPRLDELSEMGLQRSWLTVAEQIGVDAFLQVWRILDSDRSNETTDGRRLVPMRSYSSYERYQRNRYIESLARMGLNDQQIRDALEQRIGEKVTKRHICSIRRKA
jgi:hypothetical protein